MSSAAIDRSTKEDLLNRPLSSKREPQEGRRERSRSRDREPLNPHRHNRRYDNRRDPSRNGDHGRNPRNDEIVKSEPKTKAPAYSIVRAPKDEKLGNVEDDPRGEDPTTRITKKASGRGHGRNTESFDPASTLVRPDLRIQIGSPAIPKYNKALKHDDVVIVPELFGPEENWDLYYKLVDEMRFLQKDSQNSQHKGSEWISWHEGAHLISKNPKGSPTYNMVVDRLCEYFSIDKKKDIGTRFNWYRDSSDWKPFHHDSAAFNPQRARNQNITIGASFGATRELAFIRAKEYDDGDKCKLYFPQVNNGVFSFGRDANILWKHGVNALPPSEQDGKGRISIILWGLASEAIEEDGSPPLLGSDGKGPHANHNRGRRWNGSGIGNNSRNGHDRRRDSSGGTRGRARSYDNRNRTSHHKKHSHPGREHHDSRGRDNFDHHRGHPRRY